MKIKKQFLFITASILKNLIDAILKVVCLFAKKAGVRSPTMNRVLSLLTMKARAAGIYDG